MTLRTFSTGELGAAIGLTALVQAALLTVMLVAQQARGTSARPQPRATEIAVAVEPVLEPLPLLRRGGKPNPRRLPDKVPLEPKPVPRVEDAASPSPAAQKVAPPPIRKRVRRDDEDEPPPDAERTKRIEEMVQKMKEDARQLNVPEEGARDGVEGGTESDPLRARAVSLYTIKVTNWFKRSFRPPNREIPCPELKQLSARVSAFIGPGRTVTRYTMTSSGNAIFDARVRAAMDARVGQALPPPPQNFAAILPSVVKPTFQGKNPKCK